MYRAPLLFSYPIKTLGINGAYYIPTISLRQGQTAKLVQTLQFCTKMDESGDFRRSVTTEMAVRHNKCEPAPPTAFQSVLAVAAAVMQRGTPQKKSLTGKSGKAQPVPPTGIEPVRCFHRGILSPLRSPVPPRRLTVWYCSAKRGIVNPQSPAAQSVKSEWFICGERQSSSLHVAVYPAILGQYRIILSADTASEVRQMPSQKRR